MKIRVKVELEKLKKRLASGIERQQYILANQVMADSNKYVPLLSGDLRRFSQVSNDGKSVQWNSVYARRLYYNQFTNYTTPGTGPHWDKKAKQYHLSSWKKIAEDVAK
mgnify:CR=1 FL=1